MIAFACPARFQSYSSHAEKLPDRIQTSLTPAGSIGSEASLAQELVARGGSSSRCNQLCRGSRPMLPPPHQCSAPAPSRIAPGQGLRKATAWDVGAIAPAGLTAHGLVSCPLTGGAFLSVSRRSAVRRLLSWSAWLRFVCRRIHLR